MHRMGSSGRALYGNTRPDAVWCAHDPVEVPSMISARKLSIGAGSHMPWTSVTLVRGVRADPKVGTGWTQSLKKAVRGVQNGAEHW